MSVFSAFSAGNLASEFGLSAGGLLAAGGETVAGHSSSAPWILAHAWVLPALMVASFIATLFFGKRMKFLGAEFGIVSSVVTMVLAIGGVIQWVRLGPGAHGEDGAKEEALRAVGAGMRSFAAHFAGEEPIKLRDPIERSVSWFRNGSVDIGLGIHVDGFTVAMLFTVAFISLCVHVFSIEYLRGDKRFTHYFAALNLFSGAMLWMVQTSTTLGLLFGWELMGLCSFLLIGHWWEESRTPTLLSRRSSPPARATSACSSVSSSCSSPPGTPSTWPPSMRRRSTVGSTRPRSSWLRWRSSSA